MKEEIKKLWVEALRSGKYQQGPGCLRDGAKFCCLGVLCDLHSAETGMPWDGNDYCRNTGTLPGEVRRWAGLLHDNPTVRPLNSFSRKLSSVNDGGMNFSEIADLIEKHL